MQRCSAACVQHAVASTSYPDGNSEHPIPVTVTAVDAKQQRLFQQLPALPELALMLQQHVLLVVQHPQQGAHALAMQDRDQLLLLQPLPLLLLLLLPQHPAWC